MVLLRMSDRVVGVASTLVLARTLVPADFGLVAMAMSVIAVIELATAFGFDVALIQNPEPQRRHFDTAWTLTIALYTGCAALIVLLSWPTAAFYGEPRLVPVMLVIGIGWVLSGFENCGTVEFRRRMDFGREFVFVVAKRLIGFVTTMVAAVVFRSYWALVVGMVVGRAGGLLLSYVMAPYRPRLDLSAARELLSFSRWLLINNAVLVGVVRFPYFLIGRLLGPQPLGVFTLAYEIATMPATELSAPVNRAALPGYARMRAEPGAFKATFLDVGAAVVAVALPASIGLAVIADPLVRVLLGEQWLAAVPLIRILAVSAAFVAATGNNGVAHLALGAANFVSLQSALRLVALVVLGVALAPAWGITGVAVAELCGAVVCYVTSFPVVFRRLGITLGEYGGRVWRAVVATAGMATAVELVEGHWKGGEGIAAALLSLVITVPLGAVVYVVLLGLLWQVCGRPDGAERVLLNKVTAMKWSRMMVRA
jgi:lipopolysaccharide exporter